MEHPWQAYLLWIAGAALLGFLVSALGAGWLHLRRPWFVLVYLAAGSAFAYSYVQWDGLDIRALLSHHLMLGILVAVVLGFLMVRTVLSQPASPRAEGGRFLLEMGVVGVLYGAMDAVLLSVIPTLAVWGATAALGWSASLGGRLASGVLALLASALVTAAYHAGYPEFRGPRMRWAILGNDLGTLGYVVAGNPLAVVLSHMAMHMAAVYHAPETAMQCPPHYPDRRPELRAMRGT